MRKVSLIAVILVMAMMLIACGGGKKNDQSSQSESAAPAYVPDVEHGKTLFLPLCGACHGPEGLGVENLGKDMTTSTFIYERTDVGFETLVSRSELK